MNIGGILLATIAFMIIGFVWYSPALFGKKWQKLTGKGMDTIDREKMIRIFGLNTLASLVSAVVLNYLMVEFDVRTLNQALILSGMLWLGFSFTALFVNNLYQQKKFMLTVIDSGYQLAGLLTMGVLLFYFL